MLKTELAEVVVGRDEDDMRSYGTRGTILIGKHLVGSGEDAHLTSPVLMDVLRPHIITLCGKRGTGKCLHGDTLIIMTDGSLVPIKDLENNNGDVLSLSEELKVVSSIKENFYKRQVDMLLRVKLRSGREIKLTHEHPLLTIKGWKPAIELNVGSRIATPRRIDAFGSETLPEHKVKLLAYLIAEGHIANSYVLFANTDAKIQCEFEQAIHEFDTNLKLHKRGEGQYQVVQIKKNKRKTIEVVRDKKGRILGTLNGAWEKSSIVKWLEETGIYGKLSREKFIPNIVFRLDKNSIKLFLNRLFSCDGSIYKKKKGEWEISYSSISPELIKHVHHLLLRFGVISCIRKKKTVCNKKEFESFEILIRGQFVRIFLGEIGFFGRKEERQTIAISQNVNRNPNVDTIPKEIWELYRPKSWASIGRAFDYKYPKAMRESIDYSPSRQKVLQIATVENNNPLRLLAESDVFWDEIVSIEMLEGEFTVYDITVPEFHNFVANDIIVHNSYSMGIIAEEISKLPADVKKSLCVIIIDTQGIFWTMKTPNEKDIVLLRSWGAEPMGFAAEVYVPLGLEKTFSAAGVDYDSVFSISPSELTANDWLNVFSISMTEPLGILLQMSLEKLKGTYGIPAIMDSIRSQHGFENEKAALINMFGVAESWGIFGETRIPNLLDGGKISILDVSLMPQNVRALMLSIVLGKVFLERTKARRKEELGDIELVSAKRIPMPWILIDEAHNFLPAEGATPASEILSKLVKEGRQPGISLVFATQRPEKLHADALSLGDMVISHALTSKADINALEEIMQTYMLFDITKYINELPKLKGVAIILDDNSERIYKVRMRPRQSWHAGASPLAI